MTEEKLESAILIDKKRQFLLHIKQGLNTGTQNKVRTLNIIFKAILDLEDSTKGYLFDLLYNNALPIIKSEIDKLNDKFKKL